MVNLIQKQFNDMALSPSVNPKKDASNLSILEKMMQTNGLDETFLSYLHSSTNLTARNLTMVSKSNAQKMSEKWNHFYKSQNVFKWKSQQNSTPKSDYMFSKILFSWITKNQSLDMHQGNLPLKVWKAYQNPIIDDLAGKTYETAEENLVVGLKLAQHYLSLETTEQEKIKDVIKTYFKKAISLGASMTSTLAFFVLWDNIPFSWHRELILDCAKQNNKQMIEVLNKLLKFSSLEFKYKTDITNDKEIMTYLIQQNGMNIEFASEDLKKDPEFVKLAIQNNVFAYDHAALELKQNPEIIKLTVQQPYGWQALATAIATRDIEPINDPEIVKLAIEKGGAPLMVSSEEIKNNREIAALAVKAWGLALQHVSPELQNDREIVKLAVQKDGAALKFASPELQQDLELFNIAFENSGLALEFASPEQKRDPEFVKLAVRKNGCALEFASPDLRANKEIVELAIQNNGLALEFASPELRANKEIVKLAVQNDGYALRFAMGELNNDPEVVKLAVQNDGSALRYAHPKFKENKEIAELSLQGNGYGSGFLAINKELRKNPEIAKLGIKKDGSMIPFLDDTLKNNREFFISIFDQF